MENKKPKLELRNVKYAAFNSQETPCYKATLYVDGAPFAEVGNDGQGGCDYHYPINGTGHTEAKSFYERFRALNERIKATYPPKKASAFTLEPDVELVCGSLLTAWIIQRDFKAYDRDHGVKKLVGVMDGRLMEWKPKRGFKGDLRSWCASVSIDVKRQRPEVVFWDEMDKAARIEAVMDTEDEVVREALNA